MACDLSHTTQLLTLFFFFFFNDTATTEIYTLSLHDALPIYWHYDLSESVANEWLCARLLAELGFAVADSRSEEHTSELQSQSNLVCRLLLEKKKTNRIRNLTPIALLRRRN